MKLSEAKYLTGAKSEKGSLHWFLNNFFTHESTTEFESGEGNNFRVKSGFDIWARGQRVVGVEVHPDGEQWEANVVHAGTGNVQTTYLPLEDWRVHQSKQIWPQV